MTCSRPQRTATGGLEPGTSRPKVLGFIGRFQAIKTDVLLIFSFITGDKTEFLSPMMFSNEYITGI